jgi:NAD(P)H dehydrogenase (quinone)
MHVSTVSCRAALIVALLTCGMAVLAGGRAEAATSEMLIVSGASGQLGLLTVKELLRRGVPAQHLILVSRTPEKLAEFAAQGASTRYGDVDHPESLPAAFAGGDRMLMISLGVAPGNPPRPPRHKLAFDAAVKAGVKHIVYTSFLGADLGGNMLADDHRQSEEFLRASGAHWTALRNGFYADSLVQSALQMAATGKATVRAGAMKNAPVTREDCAAAAAGALLGGQRFENQAFDITGPELVDMRDVAKLVGELVGRNIEVVEQPATAAPAPGAPPQVTRAVATLAGRPATSVHALLLAHKSELQAAAAAGVAAGR